MSVRPLWAVALLAAPVLAGCSGDASVNGVGRTLAVGAWDADHRPRLAQLLGDPDESGLKRWTPPFDVTPSAIDVDGDGHKEVVALGNDSKVYVFDAADGRVLAQLPTTLPPNWYVERVLNDVAGGVLAPGEPASIVVVNHAAWLSRWTYRSGDGDSMEFNKTWEARLNKCRHEPSMDSGPTLADLNGDGRTDILVQTEENGIYAYDARGWILWMRCEGGGNGAPVVDDLDGDGKPEAIFGTDSGTILVYDAATGTPKWRYDVTKAKPAVYPGSIAVAPTVADLDGVWPKEVLFTARNAWSEDPTLWANMSMAIAAVREGELVWLVQPDWANPLSYTQLVARDVDGDGRTDIFGMDWNTIGHYPGNWENLGNSTVFRLDAEGRTVWNRSVEAWWSNKAIAVVDADGDGELEVLANGPLAGADGVWRLSAATGELEGFVGLPGWKVLRGPVVTDVLGDGSLTLMLAAEPQDPSAKPRGAIALVQLVPAGAVPGATG